MKIKTLGALLLLGANAFAETPTLKPIILRSPRDYQILAASPNGKWACGAYVDDSQTTYGFRWNLESGEVELLNPAINSIAWSISNDGMVVGEYTDNKYLGNGASATLAGYWKDNKWNRMELPEGDFSYAACRSISPDGHHMAGYVSDGSSYYAYTWTDFKKPFELTGSAVDMANAVAPDGKGAAGYVTNKNRQAVYWNEEGKPTLLTEYQGPWSYGIKFSSDGTKLLYWGGWAKKDNQYGVKAIYNIQTKESDLLYPLDESANFDLFDINNNGTVVGSNNIGYIYQNGEAWYADDYLTERGIDLKAEHVGKQDDVDYYMISRASTVSDDENVMSFQYYNDAKDENGVLAGEFMSMVVKFNQPTTGLCPVGLKAQQVKGQNSVVLYWKPNVAAQGITGYNVYRDGEKLNKELVSTKGYADNNVALGNHVYTVSAVYGSTESEKSQEADVNVAAKEASAPVSLFADQHGYNSIYMEWQKPATSFGSITYFDVDNDDIIDIGMGAVGDVMETAILVDSLQMQAYSGQQITSVGFYPMSEQSDWTVSFYTHDAKGGLTKVYSQPITQQLNYGKRNEVALTTPLTLTSADLLIAVSAKIKQTSSGVIGMGTTNFKDYYTDLVRLGADEDFVSVDQTAFQDGGTVMPTVWTIDATVVPQGANTDNDKIDHYDIYLGSSKIAATKENTYLAKGLDKGAYKIGVKAVYANGDESPVAYTSINVEPNQKLLTAIDNVLISQEQATPSVIKAMWSAPKDYDKTEMKYCQDKASENAVKGPESNNWNLTAGVLYPAEYLRGRAGYNMTSVKFYPLDDATYTIYVYENNVLINQTDVDVITKNQWNEVKLSEPITIKENCAYKVAVECYDVTPQAAPLAVDNAASVSGCSDLYTLDGETWNSLSSNSVNCNWLITATIENPEFTYLAIDGYDVTIDGQKRNTDLVGHGYFDFDFGAEDAKAHTISVDVHYKGVAEAVKGDTKTFYIGTAGIEDNNMANVEILKGNNDITVVGNGVTSVELISATGATIASAKGNTLSLNGVAAGVYVAKVNVNGEIITRKIEVK